MKQCSRIVCISGAACATYCMYTLATLAYTHQMQLSHAMYSVSRAYIHVSNFPKKYLDFDVCTLPVCVNVACIYHTFLSLQIIVCSYRGVDPLLYCVNALHRRYVMFGVYWSKVPVPLSVQLGISFTFLPRVVARTGLDNLLSLSLWMAYNLCKNDCANCVINYCLLLL